MQESAVGSRRGGACRGPCEQRRQREPAEAELAQADHRVAAVEHGLPPADYFLRYTNRNGFAASPTSRHGASTSSRGGPRGPMPASFSAGRCVGCGRGAVALPAA